MMMGTTKRVTFAFFTPLSADLRLSLGNGTRTNDQDAKKAKRRSDGQLRFLALTGWVARFMRCLL